MVSAPVVVEDVEVDRGDVVLELLGVGVGPACEPHVYDIYEATRYAWIANGSRVEQYKLVLARRGIMVIWYIPPPFRLKSNTGSPSSLLSTTRHPSTVLTRFSRNWLAAALLAKPSRDEVEVIASEPVLASIVAWE